MIFNLRYVRKQIDENNCYAILYKNGRSRTHNMCERLTSEYKVNDIRSPILAARSCLASVRRILL
jgi:hypothetical protein